jgi:hypothetical protein
MLNEHKTLVQFLAGQLSLTEAHSYLSEMLSATDSSEQMTGIMLLLSAASRLTENEWDTFCRNQLPRDDYYRNVCELGYRFLQHDPASLQRRKTIILELVESHPESALHQLPQASADMTFFNDIRPEVERRWLDHAKAKPQSIALLKNIAQFYWIHNVDAATRYLEKLLGLVSGSEQEHVVERISKLRQLHERT